MAALMECWGCHPNLRHKHLRCFVMMNLKLIAIQRADGFVLDFHPRNIHTKIGRPRWYLRSCLSSSSEPINLKSYITTSSSTWLSWKIIFNIIVLNGLSALSLDYVAFGSYHTLMSVPSA